MKRRILLVSIAVVSLLCVASANAREHRVARFVRGILPPYGGRAGSCQSAQVSVYSSVQAPVQAPIQKSVPVQAPVQK